MSNGWAETPFLTAQYLSKLSQLRGKELPGEKKEDLSQDRQQVVKYRVTWTSAVPGTGSDNRP